MANKQVITRFAPSPTGLLHKGHAYSAMIAYKFACENQGKFILRIEDIDTVRCRAEFTQHIYDDLTWLGIKWQPGVRIQSQHFDDYKQALDKLKKLDLVYPCFCTRREIKQEISRSKSAPHGPEGVHYPGICRDLSEGERSQKLAAGIDHAWRLDTHKAVEYLESRNEWPVFWHDEIAGKQTCDPLSLGDVILARKDTPTSYHLSVTVDDAKQNITHVIRGTDLFHATHIHILLQRLLSFETPIYHHHKLLLDNDGKRFAKRDKAATLKAIREEAVDPSSFFGDINFELNEGTKL